MKHAQQTSYSERLTAAAEAKSGEGNTADAEVPAASSRNLRREITASPPETARNR